MKTKKANQLPNQKVKRQEAHTDNTKFGMGDYYGTGVKQSIGRLRSDMPGYIPVSKKKMGKPPKSVV